jgi:hypothetical protein
MKTIDSISRDYQIIEKQHQSKILGGQAVYSMDYKDTYVGRNGDAAYYDDDGTYVSTVCWYQTQSDNALQQQLVEANSPNKNFFAN